jgi:uncharacterized membrane protein YbhN (UPF0104 family)
MPAHGETSQRPPLANCTGRLRPRMWILLKVAITATILAAVLRQADVAGLGQTLKTVSPSLIALTVGFLVLSPLLGGLRWWMVLRAIGVRESAGHLSACYWIGNLVSQVMPLAASDGVRIWIAARGTAPLGSLIHSALLERAFMAGTLVFVVVATGSLLPHRMVQTVPAGIGLGLLAAGLAGLGMLLMADRLFGRFGHLRPIRLLSFLSVDTRRVVFSKWMLPIFLLGLVANLNFVFAADALGAALKINLSITDYLELIPWIVLAMALPISIGGWGVREGLLLVSLGSAGVSAQNALALSLSFGGCIVISSLPGFVFFLIRLRPKLDQVATQIQPPAAGRRAAHRATLHFLRGKNHNGTR